MSAPIVVLANKEIRPFAEKSVAYGPFVRAKDSLVDNFSKWSDDTRTARMLYPDLYWGEKLNYSGDTTNPLARLTSAVSAMSSEFGTATSQIAGSSYRRYVMPQFFDGHSYKRIKMTVEGTKVNTPTGTGTHKMQVLDSGSNTYVNVYVDTADSNKLKARISTVTDSTLALTEPTATNLDTNSCTDPQLIILSTTKFAVMYMRSTTLYAVVCTVSGTTITVGTPAASGATNASLTGGNSAVAMVATDKIATLYRDLGDTSKTKIIAATISGTTLTWGTAVTVNATGTTVAIACARLDTDKLFVGYRDNTGNGNVVIVTFSGTVATVGTPLSLGSSYDPHQVHIGSTSVAFVLSMSSGTTLYFWRFTISGTTITASGSVVTLTLFGQNYSFFFIPINTTEFYWGYDSSTGTRYRFNKSSYDGTTLTTSLAWEIASTGAVPIPTSNHLTPAAEFLGSCEFRLAGAKLSHTVLPSLNIQVGSETAVVWNYATSASLNADVNSQQYAISYMSWTNNLTRLVAVPLNLIYLETV